MGAIRAASPADLAARSEIVFLLSARHRPDRSAAGGAERLRSGGAQPHRWCDRHGCATRAPAEPGPPGLGSDGRSAAAGGRPVERTQVGGAQRGDSPSWSVRHPAPIPTSSRSWSAARAMPSRRWRRPGAGGSRVRAADAGSGGGGSGRGGHDRRGSGAGCGCTAGELAAVLGDEQDRGGGPAAAAIPDAESDLPAAVVAGPLEVAAAEAARIGVPARMLAELRELGQQLDKSGLSDRDLVPGSHTDYAVRASEVRRMTSDPWDRGGVGYMPSGRPGQLSLDPQDLAQVSCRITITNTMITRIPMMVPINPISLPSSSLAPEPGSTGG